MDQYYLSLSVEPEFATYSSMMKMGISLRTVPTMVTAYTFCASRDTRVSYGWCLLIKEYFLRGLKLCGESITYQVILVSKKKIGVNHAFFRDNKASIWKKAPYIALYFAAFWNNCCLIISKKCLVTPNFFFGFQ